MNSIKQAELLARLRFLDETEAEAIGVALSKIEDRELASELEGARDDHDRHMREIDALFGECGEPFHAEVPDAFKAQARLRLDAVRRAEGQADVVQALLAAEQADANAYAAADTAKLPGDEGPVMRAHAADEQRHVKQLSGRL